MFNYKGYTEVECEKLCDSSNVLPRETSVKYWTSEWYSYGKWYRDYACISEKIPLFVYSEHGVAFDVVHKHELENDAEAMFVFSDAKLERYKKLSSKPCYKVMNPFVWYRRQNVKQVVNPSGTLVFPSHSTCNDQCIFDIDEYVYQLKMLPEDMHPVCVCLHMSDVSKGLHLDFMKRGLPVYTAGDASDLRFAERFYDLLRHFRYTMSNMIGSYTYYSIEMGIPFSLYGSKACFINISDPNFLSGPMEYETAGYKLAASLFNGINMSVTEQQREHVLACLGCSDSLSRLEMHRVLMRAYIRRKSFIYKVQREILRIVDNCVTHVCRKKKFSVEKS